MAIWQYVLILLAGLAVIFVACLAPVKFFRVVGIGAANLAMGLALLLLMDSLSAATGLNLPLNSLSLAVSAILGAPGVAALAVLAAV